MYKAFLNMYGGSQYHCNEIMKVTLREENHKKEEHKTAWMIPPPFTKARIDQNQPTLIFF